MKLVFMGTPPLALTILQSLVDGGHKIAGVVTQPDRPKGRGKVLTPSPVGQFAEELGIPVIKPESSKAPEFAQTLSSWNPDVAVVAAFGLILRKNILDIPKLGCINVHASLLPKFRGASPIQSAIIEGETETGITIMMMDEGMDTGDILLQQSTPIPDDMTAGDLEEKLARLGAETLNKALLLLEEGRLERTPQKAELATYTKPLKTEDGNIFWNLSAQNTYNTIRGCTPRPGARCFFEGNPVRIWRCAMSPRKYDGASPGEIVSICSQFLTVACQDERGVSLLEVQPANRSRMTGAEFARGARLKAGLRFDTSVS